MPDKATHTLPPLSPWHRPVSAQAWASEQARLCRHTTVFDSWRALKRALLITFFVAVALSVLSDSKARAAWSALALISACALLGRTLRNRRAQRNGDRLRLTALEPAAVTETLVYAFSHSPQLWSELAVLQKAPVPLLQGDVQSMMDRLRRDPDEAIQAHFRSLPTEQDDDRRLWRSVAFTTLTLVLIAAVIMALAGWGQFR
jgi:hypothetical protein